MKIWFAILVAVLVLSTNAHGGIPGTTIGEGAKSCGTWTEERAHDSGRLGFMKAWVLGFASGANLYTAHEDFLRRQDVPATAIYAWIDNYCRAHPLEPLDKAAFDLVAELLRRAAQSRQP